MERPIAVLAVLAVSCAAPPPPPPNLAGTILKTDLRGTWSHRVIVLGSESGPPVAAGAERREDVRFVVLEDFLEVVPAADAGGPVMVLRVDSHFTPVASAPQPFDSTCFGSVCENVVCETSEGAPPCTPWWERPRMRVDASADLVGDLPLAGRVEPIDLFDPALAPPAPTRDEGGVLAWTLEERYLVSTCDAPACESIVHVRHELRHLGP